MRISKASLIAVAVLLPLTTTGNVVAQPGCLHGSGEDGTQRARRAAAVRFVRALNTAEANGPHRSGAKYQPLTQLGLDMTAVQDFDPQFTTDGDTYALILRDKTDPCGFAISSNQQGVIFQGYPIDYDVQPVRR